MECSPRNMRTLLIESFKIYIDRIGGMIPPKKQSAEQNLEGCHRHSLSIRGLILPRHPQTSGTLDDFSNWSIW